ncbi:MAG: sugar phosphate isomerase/epimerase [Acidobacteriaceae bacterium]|nr:sugar phosphate isomerase/epimerase [Acidobacteriaceae bacterium]MBV9502726.1 sugar phosphate isomerase/epimerase [Acidobacteriaceae bacterium]
MAASAVAEPRTREFSPGVQLYTVRDRLSNAPAATLGAIGEIGYREVEMLRSQVKTIAPLLSRHQLRPISLHFETPLLTGNYTAWQHADMPPIESGASYGQSLELAKDHGFRYVVFNYLTPEERLGLDFYHALADKLNAAATKAQRAGLQFCYHNHDFEFEPKPGGRPIDVLIDKLDKNLVALEVDVFWISMAGVDAADFLRQHASRVALVHLKDRAKGTPVHYDIATVPNETFREVGSGDLPFNRILAAVADTRAKHAFVEQDFSIDPIASLRKSFTYLKQIGFYS